MMASKSNPPYEGNATKQKRGSKTNARTKPSAQMRKAARAQKRRDEIAASQAPKTRKP